MPKEPNKDHIEAWTLDQLAKSAFFHRKLHEWRLLETADVIEQIRGEDLIWTDLNISETAWNKVIHRGIKPVIVFAHPYTLHNVAGAAGYYRMLAMVSQKSMKRIGINLDAYETGVLLVNAETAKLIAQHLNRLISSLIEADEEINAREFDLWRGMAAGSQAQGSWQNNKGSAAEVVVRELIIRRLQERGIIIGDEASSSRIKLDEQRTLVFADDPDIAIYQGDFPLVAIEIKGGIDPAAVLERIGAALKSLQRIRQVNPDAMTVLIVQGVSITERAKQDLRINSAAIANLFSIEEISSHEIERQKLWIILGF